MDHDDSLGEALRKLNVEVALIRVELARLRPMQLSSVRIGFGIWFGWVLIMMTIVMLWVGGAAAVLMSAAAAASTARERANGPASTTVPAWPTTTK